MSRLAVAGLVLGLASILLYEFVALPLLAVALGAIYTVASLSAGGHVQL